MKKGFRRTAAVLLSMTLVITGMGTGAYAEEPAHGTGLCEHHKEHDSECGYVEPVEEQPCTHVHTDACYAEVEVASPPVASPGSGTERKLICTHAVEGEHDDQCGYVPAVEGHPCMYNCKECGTISYMDANGEAHHDQVGAENIITVTAGDYEWTNSAGTEVWYYLKDSQTFTERIEILSGDVNLVLGRGAVLTAQRGICVVEGASLTVYGQDRAGGTLKAYCASPYHAAIGGGMNGVTGTAGTITINSGTVYADASKGNSGAVETMYGSAGIGVGTGGEGSDITIHGGNVTAIGFGGGPGIGGGAGGSRITITGGTVTATGGSMKGYTGYGVETNGGAGIGGGESSNGGVITITGGTVRATGGLGASGIGTGSNSYGVDIQISGAETTVTAKGSDGAAGIGGGRAGATGSVTIRDGAKVTASGGRTAIDADIDFGSVYDDGSDFLVTGNEQNAEGGVVASFRVDGQDRALSAPTTDYRYLKAEPGTLKAVTISPQSVSANVGQQLSFAVLTSDGITPAADATEILNTVWTISSGIDGYLPAENTSIAGGLLSIAGDEKLEKLTVSAACELPSGVRMVRNTADVTISQTRYTVSFDANGGQTDAVPVQTTMGKLTGTLPTASRTGYTFTGWYLNRPAEGSEPNPAVQVSDNTVYTQDTTLYAGWRINQYTVTYYSMGGNPASFTRTVSHGGHAPTPATPVKDLGVFQGWYTDLSYTTRWDFDRDTVTGDTQLYARWADEVLDVTVSAEADPVNGGRVLYAGKYRSGSIVTLEAVPDSGYQFRYWMKDGEVVSNTARYLFTAKEDTQLKAVFTWVGLPGSGTGSSGGSSGSVGGGSGVSGNTGSSGVAGGSGSGFGPMSGSGSGSVPAGGSGSGTGPMSGSGSGSAPAGGSGSGSGPMGGSGSGTVPAGDSESGSGPMGGSGSASDSMYSATETEAQNSPAAAALIPTVVPGSGSAVSTIVAVADAAETNVANAQSVAGAWVQSEQGWSLQVDGKSASNSWVCVAEKDGAHWYHFGDTGLMDTGWLELDGKKYYLYAVHDGTAGRMLTGWQLLDGKWYYFSSASDATLGTLLTNTVTPDGYRVNEQGEWIQ